MNQAKLAEARRLYHHVCNGGTLTPEDVSFMVVALEEEIRAIRELISDRKEITEALEQALCLIDANLLEPDQRQEFIYLVQVCEEMKELNT